MPLAWETVALDGIQPLGMSPSQHQPIWTKLTIYYPSPFSLSRETGEDPVSIVIQAGGQEHLNGKVIPMCTYYEELLL